MLIVCQPRAMVRDTEVEAVGVAPHQHYRQRPTLSRRKLKALTGNSEGFFCRRRITS
jgi:hypothetical protein